MDDLLLQCVQIKDLELGFYFNLKSKIFFFFLVCVVVCLWWVGRGGGGGWGWRSLGKQKFCGILDLTF